MDRAPYRNWHEVFTYVENERHLEESENDFIHLEGDFIILSGQQDTAFHKYVEDVIGRMGGKPLEVIRNYTYFNQQTVLQVFLEAILDPRTASDDE